jgi:putative membrane protein
MSCFQNVLPEDLVNGRIMVAFLVVWAATCWNVSYPTEYFAMQHLPTLVAAAGLIVAERKLRISRLSFGLIIAFLLLHLIGARYLYSYVPYDDWSQTILGFRIGEQLGFERNQYDRFVHFCFGLLFVYPLWELFARHARLGGWWPGVLAICIVLAASAVYEIVEWATAMAFAPDWAEAYNGQQGDLWDAQKDMVLAAVGSILGTGIVGLACRPKTRRQTDLISGER